MVQPEKSYGFLVREDGSDVFVHYSGINGDGYRSLEEDQKVTFEVVDGEKRLQATNVEIAKD